MQTFGTNSKITQTTRISGSLSPTGGVRELRYLLAVLSIILLVVANWAYLKHHGHFSPNNDESDLRTVWLRMVPPVSFVRTKIYVFWC